MSALFFGADWNIHAFLPVNFVLSKNAKKAPGETLMAELLCESRLLGLNFF